MLLSSSTQVKAFVVRGERRWSEADTQSLSSRWRKRRRHSIGFLSSLSQLFAGGTDGGYRKGKSSTYRGWDAAPHVKDLVLSNLSFSFRGKGKKRGVPTEEQPWLDRESTSVQLGNLPLTGGDGL